MLLRAIDLLMLSGEIFASYLIMRIFRKIFLQIKISMKISNTLIKKMSSN